MRCKVKRGDSEGTIIINGEEKKYKTYRIRVVYRWMGYSYRSRTKEEQNTIDI